MSSFSKLFCVCGCNSYNKMGKVNPLCNRIEPVAALFWFLAMYLPTPDPARRPGITPPRYTKHVLIWSGCLYVGEELFQFPEKMRWPAPFSYL